MFNSGKRHRRCAGRALLLCTLFCGTSHPASSQTNTPFAPYPEEATDKSALLGGWLESRFSRMVDSCTDKKWDRKVKRLLTSYPVTVVPNRLSTRYSLTRNTGEAARQDRITRIFDLGSQSLPALFARVRPGLPAGDSGIEGKLLPNGPGSDALNFADMAPELRLASPHFNGASYSSACATSISYAFDLSGGYSMPAAGVKAALSGSGSETTTNALRIVEGVFYSPFAAMWLGTYSDYSDVSGTSATRALPADAVEPLRTHVGLIFWRWYTEHPASADHDNGILEYFSGIALQEENQSASKRSAEVSGEFSASLPVLSASLKGKFATNSTSDFWSRDYFLAAFRDGRSRHAGSHYMRLPKPAEIGAHFAGLQLLPWSGTDNITIYNNSPVTISQYIHGVTAPHCATSNWEVKAADGTAAAPQGLKRRRVVPAVDAQQVPICLLELDYTPTDTDVNNGATLQFALVHRKAVTSAGGAVQLRLAGWPVTLKSYSRPDWRKLSQQAAIPYDPLNVSSPITADSHPTQLEWRVDYQFDPKGAPGQLIEDSLAFENASTRCTNGEPLSLINATPILETRPGLGKVLIAKLTAGVPTGTPLSAPVGSPTCQFSATVRYRLNLTGSPELRTPLASASFLYPMPLQASVNQ